VAFLSEAEKTGISERRVVSTLTASHLVQHLFSGASILYQSIREELGLSYTQLGAMIGLANILGGLLQMVYSIAGRKVSRSLLLSGSNFFMSLGCLLTGTANRFEAVITGNAVASVGQAGTHPVSSSILSSKFEEKGIGSALSIFYGLGFVGNIISPILLSSIAAAAGGPPTTSSPSSSSSPAYSSSSAYGASQPARRRSPRDLGGGSSTTLNPL
jgi:FSR family fosmidomycin resistance protein-like MFS transporter